MKNSILTASVFLLLISLFGMAATDWKLPWAAKPGHGTDWCEEHKVEQSKCTICNPQLARGGTFAVRERDPQPGECPNTLVKLTLGPDVARQANLQYFTVEARPLEESVRGNAETLYMPIQYARIAPRIAGVVREVKAPLGQDVDAGAPLAVIESSEFAQAKLEHLQALAILDLRQKNCAQEKQLYDKNITTGRELLLATSDLEQARLSLERTSRRLMSLGLSPEQVEEVGAKRDSSGLMSVVAPFAGTVVEASAVAGEIAAPERPIFGIALLDRLWVSIDVDVADLSKIEKDQRVSFVVEGLAGQKFVGKVVAVSGEVDDRTRTVKVYAEVKNTQRLLRAKMFGQARVTIKSAEPKIVIPKDAVQTDGDCYFVFVAPTANVFHSRKIDLGARYDGRYEVVGGLAPGERIVTTGSFLLKTEVMRGAMGAG